MSRIVVIEDDPVCQEVLRNLLADHGHEVWVAGDGVQGVALCAETKPDVIITDLVMPVQDGFLTIEQVRERFPRVPIIAMSGMVGAGRQAAVERGATCSVSKPVDGGQLLRLVREVLDEAPPAESR